MSSGGALRQAAQLNLVRVSVVASGFGQEVSPVAEGSALVLALLFAEAATLFLHPLAGFALAAPLALHRTLHLRGRATGGQLLLVKPDECPLDAGVPAGRALTQLFRSRCPPPDLLAGAPIPRQTTSAAQFDQFLG